MSTSDVSAANSSPEKQPDVGNKNICKIIYFFLWARAWPALDHVDLNFWRELPNRIRPRRHILDEGKQNKIGKQQCLPNLRRQLLLQDKHPNNYCIFKYIMIVPTSAFQKIYNRRTLGLLLRCLKLALGPGEKKKQREISISAQFVHAHFTRKLYILYKFKVPNFIQNCKSLTWSPPPTLKLA